MTKFYCDSCGKECNHDSRDTFDFTWGAYAGVSFQYTTRENREILHTCNACYILIENKLKEFIKNIRVPIA